MSIAQQFYFCCFNMICYAEKKIHCAATKFWFLKGSRCIYSIVQCFKKLLGAVKKTLSYCKLITYYQSYIVLEHKWPVIIQ